VIFHRVQPDENFPGKKLVSETGRWEMGFRQMLFGLRVSAGLSGSGGVTLDYCAGGRLQDQLLLFGVILRLLERLPEEITEGELRRLLPKENRRPIRNDPECLAALLVLAGTDSEQVPAWLSLVGQRVPA